MKPSSASILKLGRSLYKIKSYRYLLPRSSKLELATYNTITKLGYIALGGVFILLEISLQSLAYQSQKG